MSSSVLALLEHSLPGMLTTAATAQSLDTSLNYVLACVGPSFIVARRPTARTAWAPNNTVIRQLRPAKLCLGLAARAFRAARALRNARKATATRTLEILSFCASRAPRLKRRPKARTAYDSRAALSQHTAQPPEQRNSAAHRRAAAETADHTRTKDVVRQRQRRGHAFT